MRTSALASSLLQDDLSTGSKLTVLMKVKRVVSDSFGLARAEYLLSATQPLVLLDESTHFDGLQSDFTFSHFIAAAFVREATLDEDELVLGLMLTVILHLEELAKGVLRWRRCHGVAIDSTMLDNHICRVDIAMQGSLEAV